MARDERYGRVLLTGVRAIASRRSSGPDPLDPILWTRSSKILGMATSYTSALYHLAELGAELAPGTRRKWDLAHMRTLVGALEDPQAAFPAILIAGTNGKGSTAATLGSILTAAGYRTALYTSPHLVRVNERIVIDGVEIPDDTFARLYFRVDDAAQRLVTSGELPYPPSFFEVLTAVAFCYFAEAKVDLAVLEVGLGGRLDATNIVTPLLSILTDVALDHQEYLGATLTAITREKCGILRHGGTLITLPQHPEANQAIGEAAAGLDLHAISATPYLPSATWRGAAVPAGIRNPAQGPAGSAEAAGLPANRYTVSVGGEPVVVDSPLPGQHQQRNLALAIAAAAELRQPTRGGRRHGERRRPLQHTERRDRGGHSRHTLAGTARTAASAGGPGPASRCCPQPCRGVDAACGYRRAPRDATPHAALLLPARQVTRGDDAHPLPAVRFEPRC